MSTLSVQENNVTFPQVAMTRVLIRRMQARRSALYGRWDEAFRRLDLKDKITLRAERTSRFSPESFLQSLENKRKKYESEKKTFKKSDGTEVSVSDVLENITSWVRRFERVGDSLVQFDPVHAAIPWASVKFLIEVAVDHYETYAKITEGLEIVSHIIVQVTEVEKPLLAAERTGLKMELSRIIVELYFRILRFLAEAKRYFDRNAGMRMLKSIFHRLKSFVSDFIHGASFSIAEIYRLNNQIQWEVSHAISKQHHHEMRTALEDLLEKVTSPKKSISNRRLELRSWLAPTFTDDARKEAFSLRHGSTCDWVLDLPEFKSWAEGDCTTSKVLWIHGPAGFGKTVLCARIIDYMKAKSNLYGQILGFFCSGADCDRRHPFSILKSWIGQLISEDDEAVELAMEDDQLGKKVRENAPVSDADLWPYFRRVLGEKRRRTLVIDGYDECIDTLTRYSKYHNKPWRRYFLEQLMASIGGTGTRLLLISRNQIDIETVLKESASNPELLELLEHSITKEDTTRDISSFSGSVLARKLWKIPTEKRSAMAAKATVKSEGMFLWISLLDKKLMEGATQSTVNRLIEKTPSEIDDAYKMELGRILNPNGDQSLVARAVVILKWVLFALRPLTVRELTEAIAVAFNDSTEYPSDDLPDPFTEESIDEKYVENYIRMPCGSLIKLQKEDENTPLPSQTVHFVHFSVKEFLLQNTDLRRSDPNLRIAPILDPWNPDPLKPSGGAPRLDGNNRHTGSDRRLSFDRESIEHDWFASLCLQYMCYDEFEDTSKNGMEEPKTFLGSYPFFSYSAENWPDHFRRGESSSTHSDTSELAWEMFSTYRWRTWARIFDMHLEERCRDPRRGEQNPLGSKLRGRADSGYGSFDDDISEHPRDIPDLRCKCFRGRNSSSPSPVYYAAILGLDNVVERLLKVNPDHIGLAGGDLGSPLQAAVVFGRTSTVRILLKHGAKPSQPGGKYGTPLNAAVLLGSKDIFEQLTNECLDIDVADEHGKRALHHACVVGDADMVKKLVELGANPNSKTQKGQSPLVLAMIKEHWNIVEYLLHIGADPNEYEEGQKTPLFHAINMENESILRLLLRHGADPLWQPFFGLAALHMACYASHVPSTRVLLEFMVPVEVQDNEGWTPLHYAVLGNSQQCVELLLAHGASPLTKANDSRTPFSIAVTRRHKDIVTVFCNHTSMDSASAAALLPVALESGDIELIHRLLEYHTEPVSNDSVQDVLALALKTEKKSLYDLLAKNICKRGTSGDGPDSGNGDEPVWTHAEEQLLREEHWGSDTQKDMVLDPAWLRFSEAQNVLPTAMLSVAASNRSHTVVHLLLDLRADIHHRMYSDDGSWYSAFQLAVNQDSREIVRLMLSNATPPASENLEALLEALESAGRRNGMDRKDLVKMLINHGALDAKVEGADKTKGSSSTDKLPQDSNDTGTSPNPDWWSNMLIGQWAGAYDYGSLKRIEPTQFVINSVALEHIPFLKKRVILFEGEGKDNVAEFTLHGQVMSGRTIRFVKLYPKFGWMYEGTLEEADGNEDGEKDGSEDGWPDNGKDGKKWRIRGRWATRFGDKETGSFTATKGGGIVEMWRPVIRSIWHNMTRPGRGVKEDLKR